MNNELIEEISVTALEQRVEFSCCGGGGGGGGEGGGGDGDQGCGQYVECNEA